MSHDLLRTWLQLSASSWPPDHYTLLGLRPGEGATDEIEMRVLERMDMLRRYQLLHPEQVTEGMNRLAQAMNCLMDLDSRRAYDAKLNLSPPPLPKNRSTPPSMGIPVGSVIELPPPLPPSSKPTVVAESGSPSRPTVLRESSSTPAPRLEKVYTPGDEPPPINKPPITPELIEEEDEPLQLEDIEELEESFEDEESRPSKKKSKRVDPEERRPFYSELARIRRVLRIWKQLRQYLADPEKAFNRRTDTVGFMTCLSDLRACSQPFRTWLAARISRAISSPPWPNNLSSWKCFAPCCPVSGKHWRTIAEPVIFDSRNDTKKYVRSFFGKPQSLYRAEFGIRCSGSWDDRPNGSFWAWVVQRS